MNLQDDGQAGIGDGQASVGTEWASGARTPVRPVAHNGAHLANANANATEIATEIATGGRPSRRASSRVASSRVGLRANAVSDLRARRIAAVVLLLAFVLVVVAQWKPWFRLNVSSLDLGNSDGVSRSIDATDALYALVVPYYFVWTLIAMAGGAAVFGSKRLRRTAAGIAAGALAGQTMIVLAAWHDGGVGGYRGLIAQDSPLHSTRQSGLYFAVAALGGVALALLIAVRGRLVPTEDEDEAVTLAAPSGNPAGDDLHMPVPRNAVRAGGPWIDHGEDLGGGAADIVSYEPSGSDHAASRQTAVDHSMYMRPQDASANR